MRSKLPAWLNFPFILASAWFVGLFMLYWMYQITDISFTETVKWLLVFAVAFTLVPYKYVLKIVTIEYSHLLALNVIGFGPFFTGLFLVLNMLFASPPTVKTYVIERSGRSVVPFENHFILVELENGALEAQRKFRLFDEAYSQDIRDAGFIKYTISPGLFGYDVLEDYELGGVRLR